MKSPTVNELKALMTKHKVTLNKAAKMALVNVATFRTFLAGKAKMHPYVYVVFKRNLANS